MDRNYLPIIHDTFRKKKDVKPVSSKFRYRYCCVSVIMQPAGYLTSPHLTQGAIWDPWLRRCSPQNDEMVLYERNCIFIFLDLPITSQIIEFKQAYWQWSPLKWSNVRHKFPFWWSPRMNDKSIVTFNWPTVVSWHGSIQPPLIPYFHFTNILMKPLPLFITQITKIFGEVVKMTGKEVKLDTHVSIHIL